MAIHGIISLLSTVGYIHISNLAYNQPLTKRNRSNDREIKSAKLYCTVYKWRLLLLPLVVDVHAGDLGILLDGLSVLQEAGVLLFGLCQFFSFGHFSLVPELVY